MIRHTLKPVGQSVAAGHLAALETDHEALKATLSQAEAEKCRWQDSLTEVEKVTSSSLLTYF